MSTFGERLKTLREESKLSQQELGAKLNLSQSTIAYYESNKKQPSQTTLKKMAKYFSVSTDYILAQSNNPTPSNPPQKKKPKDLLRILEQEDYTLNGEIASPADKEKIAKIIELMYWDAKEQNKRKK
ncbi:MAG: helix-turn-helix transcriptional regulator [Veillonellales bacterium]